MISAIAAREREIAEVRAPVRLKRCSLYFVPPHKIDSPSTSRMLPIIEPAIDALTTLLRPFESAITAMISSAALPNVAFNNPPAPSPIRVANTSVARPHQSRQRNNANGRANEKRGGVLHTRPEPQCNRDRHKQNEPG